jgi:hypothetical protein
MKEIIDIKATQTSIYHEFRVLDKYDEYSLYQINKEPKGWTLYKRVRMEKIEVEIGITSISAAKKLAIADANN